MDSQTLTSAYVYLRQRYNDLRVVAGAKVNESGFTLLGIVKNEMYFLPAFLAHYRRLGVEMFVFLDNGSDDGSLQYICKQPDTVVVQSSWAYGDKFDVPASLSNKIKYPRIVYLWRAMLQDMFAQDRWALQVDLDEFVHLPGGMTFPDLVVRLERRSERSVWGVMLDVYPKDIAALADHEKTSRLDMAALWYFDGEQHIRLRPDRSPKVIHPGARARLYCNYGVERLYPALGVRKRNVVERLFRKMLFGHRPLRYNVIWKPTLMKWGVNSYFRSSHHTNLPASPHYLLPIQHFRFAGSVYKKVRVGLREKSYFGGSIDHRLLRELLQTMEEQNGSFLYRKSRPFETFEDLVDTRNAIGL